MDTKLKLGVIVPLGPTIREELEKTRALGLESCQVGCWNPELFTTINAQALIKASKDFDVEVTAIWTGYPGPAVWNFIDGPLTIGFPPPSYRYMRMQSLCAGADFAHKVGVKVVTTHAGFLPENPKDPDYQGAIVVLRQIAAHCKNLGLTFAFETGQETPVTLLRAIHDVDTDNLGVNLDPANLLLYGKANPVDALDIIGKYVVGVHAKDGEYPTDPYHLGEEKPLGQGRVNFQIFVPKLKALGYAGALTIEREISGPKQIEDIQAAIKLLRPLC